MLQGIGLDSLVKSWLVDKNTAMTTIILVNTWCGIGFHMTVSYAAISGIPDDVVEAAKLDGAVGLKKVFHIIIPMIWESIISSIVVIVSPVHFYTKRLSGTMTSERHLLSVFISLF